MHRRDLESLLYPGIRVVASVFRLSAWRTDQHSSHRHSGTRYCHTQSFEPLSWCHLIFLSTFLRRPDDPFGGHGTDGGRIACSLCPLPRGSQVNARVHSWAPNIIRIRALGKPALMHADYI